MGYNEDNKSYYLWDCKFQKIIKSRDVLFNKKNLDVYEDEMAMIQFSQFLRSEDNNGDIDYVVSTSVGTDLSIGAPTAKYDGMTESKATPNNN